MRKSVLISVLMALVFLGGVCLAHGFPAVEVYKNTSKSVVLIVSGSGRGDSLVGAGSVITPDGMVITNAHVVIDKRSSSPYREISVFIRPEEVTGNFGRDLVNRYKASVVAYDTALDLAVLKVDGLPGGILSIKFADPRGIMVGEEVVAIGHPEQGGLWTLTYGRISGQIMNQGKVRGKDVYQTDTSVNRGNSGGPLLDGRGYMVGVNTSIARLGAGNLPITGVNFALKSSTVKGWLDGKGLTLTYGREAVHERPKAEGLKSEEARPAPPVEAAPPEKRPMAEERPGVKTADMGIKEEETMSDTILTPKRPYAFNDLFEEVEKELEDMMEDMKMKIRK